MKRIYFDNYNTGENAGSKDRFSAKFEFIDWAGQQHGSYTTRSYFMQPECKQIHQEGNVALYVCASSSYRLL
jgi:hypothetical protein